jgi:hypothetical protein
VAQTRPGSVDPFPCCHSERSEEPLSWQEFRRLFPL